MKWKYAICGILSIACIFLGTILGHLNILSGTQGIIVSIIGWALLLVLSIARVVEIRKYK